MRRFCWLVFGPSGHHRQPDGFVIGNYTRRLPQTAHVSRHVKTLVRTNQLLGIDYTPHAAECSGPACNTQADKVLPYAIQPTECHDVMVIDDYLPILTKSLEEGAFKRRRGRVDLREPSLLKIAWMAMLVIVPPLRASARRHCQRTRAACDVRYIWPMQSLTMFALTWSGFCGKRCLHATGWTGTNRLAASRRQVRSDRHQRSQ
jgi:hypothetical protein